MRPWKKIKYIWNRYFGGLLYCLFVLWIGVAAARQGLSNYYADAAVYRWSVSEADTAVAWQSGNPNAYRSRGSILLKNRDFESAATDFEHAITIRNNDFRLWLQLADARNRAGDDPGAETAYQHTISLAPRYSELNYEMGKFLLETSQRETGFQYLSKAAEYDPQLYPAILQLAETAFPGDANAIENSIQPKTVDAKKILASFFINQNLMSENVRSFLLSDELSESEKIQIVRLLVEKGKFLLARQVWLSGRKMEEGHNHDLIFDGGFEKTTKSDPSGFGWQIDQNASALDVSIDETQFHSGLRSALIGFKGNVDVDRKLVSQLLYLDPQHKYELTLFARSNELITAGPPAIAVHDAVTKELLGQSDPIPSTGGKWVQIRIPFITKNSPAVTVSLLRPACNTSPCPIFGDLSIDDFSLLAIPNVR